MPKQSNNSTLKVRQKGKKIQSSNSSVELSSPKPLAIQCNFPITGSKIKYLICRYIYCRLKGIIVTRKGFLKECHERLVDTDFCEVKVADLEETKRCTGLESADGVRPMGQKNML